MIGKRQINVSLYQFNIQEICLIFQINNGWDDMSHPIKKINRVKEITDYEQRAEKKTGKRRKEKTEQQEEF